MTAETKKPSARVSIDRPRDRFHVATGRYQALQEVTREYRNCSPRPGDPNLKTDEDLFMTYATGQVRFGDWLVEALKETLQEMTLIADDLGAEVPPEFRDAIQQAEKTDDEGEQK